MQYFVSFSSALKNIHSGVGAYGSCVVRLYLLRVMKSEMFACVEKKELTQAGEEAFFLHSRKHTLPIMHLAAMSWPPVHITIMISEETKKKKKVLETDLFFIFILQPQPVLYAVPGLKECLPLSPFCQNPHKDPIQIYTDKKDCIGHKL